MVTVSRAQGTVTFPANWHGADALQSCKESTKLLHVAGPTLYVIPLSEAHTESLNDFDCGSEPWAADQNDFIRNDALEDQHRNLNRTYLFQNEAGNCAGFVTVLASLVEVEHTGLSGREVRYPAAPALLVGRFAVHKSYQGQGVAPYLMAWVRRLARNLPIGCRFLALHVEPENERAIRFYDKEGFITPPTHEPEKRLRLMLYDLL